ncbi:MAG: tetratricopeptide repeat protein [Acidimicrobiales bacterium]
MADRPDIRGFVGRADELAEFDRATASARDGVPVVLAVSGEAGIGKTTFVKEGASRSNVPLHVGRCVRMGGDVIPLAPLADLLRQIHRAHPDLLTDGPEMAPLTRWMGGELDDRAAAGTATTSLFVAVLELLTRLADDAIAIAVEDLHWADALTWDLFEFLARNLVDERVVLVGTYRTSEVSTAAQRRRLAGLPLLSGARRIHLEGLGRADVDTCVTGLLGAPAPSHVVDEILARGQGNPFFTEELVAAHVAGEAIPVVLSDLISADVAALDEPTRQVLRALATVGRETSHDLLSRISGLDEAAVEAAVRVAVEAQLLVVDRATDAYRFRHALIGEVVYADLLPSERNRFHRRVADALGEQADGVLARPDRAGELAVHLDRAGDRDAAFSALLSAADASQEIAPATALAHLERAFELWDTVTEVSADEQRSHRMWQAAELAAGAVGNARAVELAQGAVVLGPPPEGESRGHERLARYLWGAGQIAASRAEFERAVALLPADASVDAAPVYAGLGQAELMSGHYEAADGWCRRTLEALGTPEVDVSSWVMARRVQGVVRSCLGDPDGGVELCREAWQSAPTALGRALATLYLCVALLDAGRNEEAVNIALDAVVEGQLAGMDASYGGYSDALAAEGLGRMGRWDEAAALLVRHASDDTLPVGNMRVAGIGATLAARRGDADEARRLLAIAAAQPVDGWHRTTLDMTIACVHLALGDWAEAAAAVERARAEVPVDVVLWSARFVMAGVEAEVERALDAVARQEPIDVTEVLGRLRQQIEAVESLPGGTPSLDTLAHLAQAHAHLTRLAAPDPDAWATAARRWADLGDQWRIAVAMRHEAEAASTTGAVDRAASTLREAHRRASELGATPLLGELDAFSRRTRLSIDAPERVILDDTSIDRLGLTTREAEVLGLVAAGRTNRQIGTDLFISEKTASVHVSNILRKLGVTSRVDAAAVAQRLGIT